MLENQRSVFAQTFFIYMLFETSQISDFRARSDFEDLPYQIECYGITSKSQLSANRGSD